MNTDEVNAPSENIRHPSAIVRIAVAVSSGFAAILGVMLIASVMTPSNKFYSVGKLLEVGQPRHLQTTPAPSDGNVETLAPTPSEYEYEYEYENGTNNTNATASPTWWNFTESPSTSPIASDDYGTPSPSTEGEFPLGNQMDPTTTPTAEYESTTTPTTEYEYEYEGNFTWAPTYNDSNYTWAPTPWNNTINITESPSEYEDVTSSPTPLFEVKEKSRHHGRLRRRHHRT